MFASYKRVRTDESPSDPPQSTQVQGTNEDLSNQIPIQQEPSQIVNSQPESQVNLEDRLVADPGLRPPILSYDANKRENIRRAYLIKGPCQPMLSQFPKTLFSGISRKFKPEWYKEFASWLEYSEDKDAAFCLNCYLFKADHGGQGGGDAFVQNGFRNWKKKSYLKDHVGEQNSIHRRCVLSSQVLMNPKQHIDINLGNISDQARMDYRARLLSLVKCTRWLLSEALPFRGHDETDDSKRPGLFLSLLEFLSENNDDVKKVVRKNAPENHKLTSPQIQKDICSAAAFLTMKAIIKDIGDEYFSLLVDEARDASTKEQMAVVLRYVNKHGCIMERFLGIVHVSETSARSLKAAIESLFAIYGLSMSRIRGQGYDGASNMRGEFNGLKSLILSENKSAFYIHCFAHQLQLTLVAVAKKHKKLHSFFDYLALLSNIIGVSCKRKDILRMKHIEKIIQGINCGEIKTGRGLNQETTLKRPGDTRWGSHYGTILSLITLFSVIIDVLDFIAEDVVGDKSTEASTLLLFIQDFEFVFLLYSMKTILGITNDLSQALQRKDQDLVNAMVLVNVTKQRLQRMRDSGWEKLLDETCAFCIVHDINIPKMEDTFVFQGRSRRRSAEVTNLHHYQVELLYTVIDSQLQELNDRFDNVNTKLLSCMGCLDPGNSFSLFDKKKLVEFARFYPGEFDDRKLLALDVQLDNYIVDVRNDHEFSDLNGISDLAEKLVKKKKHNVYNLVYLLLKLALILPVATATVERVFSAMNIIKRTLRNRIGDVWLNDCLISYIENDVFKTIENEAIMEQFQAMKPRRMLL